MKLRTSLIFILICLLIDDFFAFVWPSDFTYAHMSFISHLGFMALMLLVVSQSWLTRILLSFLCGIVTDFFFTQGFPLHTILYTCFGYVCGLLYPWIKDRLLYRTLWVFVLMLLQDIVCFIFFSWTGTLSIPFKHWLYTFGFFSWILNGLLLLGLEYVLGVMDRYTMIRQNRILKMERSRYKKLRFMRK